MMDERLERFINSEKGKAYSRAEKKVQEEYTHAPGYKKGQFKKYKVTEEYKQDVKETRDKDPLYIALNGKNAENNPIVLEAFHSYLQKKEEDRIKQEEKLEQERLWKERAAAIAELEKEKDEWLKIHRDEVIQELEDIFEDIKEDAVKLQERDFLSEKQMVKTTEYSDYQFGRWYTRRSGNTYVYEDEEPLSKENWHEFVWALEFDEEQIASLMGEDWIGSVIIKDFMENHPELERFEDCYISEDLTELICDEIETYEVERLLSDAFPSERIEELIRQNPHYKGMFSEIEEDERKRKEWETEKERAEREMRAAITGRIPENPVNLFPLARELRRKIILHVGPTNSGKTHDALQGLEAAPSGIYLAPLRLMAYEAYEKMNADGVLCAMETGEEHKRADGARHFAKTIELFDPLEKYAVAVIDEVQMVVDPVRGGAWTDAIIGVCAREVHICLSPDAESIIKRILEECGDDVKVEYHERKTPLVVEVSKFSFPESVQKGDALIVFSKRNVISCAADLQAKGYKCSIIYGALPYDVRQNEVKRFQSGETDVVVSTDAIGMGMNLPVRRIVFLETSKYDGKQSRPLKPSEIKQIAGRAGRYGLYDTGYCTSEFDRALIRKGIEKKDPDIRSAVLGFPESVITVDGTLSDIMQQWQGMAAQPGYEKADISDLLSLTREMEELTQDKKTAYLYATIPFDTKNEDLLYLWRRLAAKAVDGEDLGIKGYIGDADAYKDSLQGLEEMHKRYDLLYGFARKGKDIETMEMLVREKEKVSGYIMVLLKKKALPKRKCKYCGGDLPWNYPYGMCSSCHDELLRASPRPTCAAQG